MERIKAPALIIDGDGTLWEGRVAEGIGKSYLKRELLRGHLRTVIKGLEGAKEVKKVVATAGANKEAEGLKKFYEVLVSLGVGDESTMQRYAFRYIHEHRIKSVEELLEPRVGWTTPRILSTIGGSTAAYAATKYFGIDFTLCNSDQFTSDGRLRGVELKIRNGEEKLYEVSKMLDKIGANITECVAVGNDSTDVPILKSAGLRYASPMATDEVKKIPRIIQLRR